MTKFLRYSKLIVILLYFNVIGYSQNDSLPKKINLDDQIIYHTAYILSYNETHEQPNWVKYMVTKSELSIDKADRKNNFTEDTLVPTGTASPEDYYKSGYDKGHLAPASTFSDNQKEMDESFFMSNMSPQVPSFNRGIWKKMEDFERRMAMEKDTVYVICGPVLVDGLKTIGKNEVSVPELFFKIIYYKDWMVCFLIKNEKSNLPIKNFQKSIDIIEDITKIDFNL